MFKKSIIVLLAFLHFHTHAGLWSDIGDFAKGAVGYVYDVGAAVISPVTNWLGKGNKQISYHSYSPQGQKPPLSPQTSALQSQYSRLTIEISSLRRSIADINSKISVLDSRVSENAQKNKLQDLELELQAKEIRKNTMLITKNKAENRLINDAKDAFNKSPEAVRAYILKRISDISETDDPIVFEHKVSVLNQIMLSALENSMMTDKEGREIFPLAYRNQIQDLLSHYKQRLQTLPFPPNAKTNLNSYIDEVTISLLDHKKRSLELATKEWKRYTNDGDEKFSQSKFKESIKEKSNKRLRDLSKKFIAELENETLSNYAKVYRSLLISEASKLSFSQRELEDLENQTDIAMKRLAEKIRRNSKDLDRRLLNIDKEKNDYLRKTYQREQIEPCLQLLSQNHPESLKSYYDSLFKLSLYKIAWAYQDASNKNGKNLEEVMRPLILATKDSDLSALVENSVKDDLENNLTLQNIISVQQARHKDGKNKQYLLNETDQYALSRSKQFDQTQYLKSILELVNNIYQGSSKSTYPVSVLQSRIDLLLEDNKRYEQNLTAAIGSIPSCQKLSSDISECHLKNKKAGFKDLIKAINDLENAFLTKLENSNLPDISTIENHNKKIAKLNLQRKECRSSKGEIVATGYSILYKDMNLLKYKALVQPGDIIYIDYQRHANKNSLPILDENKNPVGWILREHASFTKDTNCLKFLEVIDVLKRISSI